MPDDDLICIGSGPAGQRGAVQAAKLGKRVAVIEKQTCIGGVCIETGTIPSKTICQAVIGLGGGPDYFLETVFNYPTLAECYKVAAYNASNKINDVKRIKARRAATA